MTNGKPDGELATKESKDGLEAYFSLAHFRLSRHEVCDSALTQVGSGTRYVTDDLPATDSQQGKRVNHMAFSVWEGRNWASVIWKSGGTLINYLDICPDPTVLHLQAQNLGSWIQLQEGQVGRCQCRYQNHSPKVAFGFSPG